MPQTFIFIGRSGCGKGTQAKLLIDYLTAAKKTAPAKIFYLETGARFREFIQEDNYSAQLAKQIMTDAGRQPDFLAVWMWSHLLIEHITGEEDLVFDGLPRSLLEAQTLETAIKFYDRPAPTVIYLRASPEWAAERLKERQRADDQTSANIAKRLAWFETDVVPALDWYRTQTRYRFWEFDGEQPIATIHQDLITRL